MEYKNETELIDAILNLERIPEVDEFTLFCRNLTKENLRLFLLSLASEKAKFSMNLIFIDDDSDFIDDETRVELLEVFFNLSVTEYNFKK